MSDFDGWMPIRVARDERGPFVQWFFFGDITLDETYFGDTVARAAKRPFNLAFMRTTSLDEAISIASERPAGSPSGFIYHLSRCGSTLVSKAFAQKADVLVLSEPGPLNDLLTGEDASPQALRAMVTLLTHCRHEAQTRTLIKLDAWHARYIDRLVAAFPGVPSVFLARDPLEVLVSHLGAMSYMMSAANAPKAIGLSISDASAIAREEYVARVLGGILEAAGASRAVFAQIVDYADLPEAIWDVIAPAFGMEFSEKELARVHAMTAYHAKRGHERFAPDSAAKQAFATDAMREAVAKWAERPYRNLALPMVK